MIVGPDARPKWKETISPTSPESAAMPPHRQHHRQGVRPELRDRGRQHHQADGHQRAQRLKAGDEIEDDEKQEQHVVERTVARTDRRKPGSKHSATSGR